jgi:hypothetical protein
MQIGMFNTAPFVTLADLIKIRMNRTERALENPCQKCIQQFDGVGKEFADFARSVEGNAELFEFVANVLRTTKRIQFKFKSAEQLYSELRSIRKVIRRMQCGSAKDADYDMYLSFSRAIKDGVEARVRAAA